MNDVENDLIDLLQMKADEAMAQAPHRMPAELRRQARRRLIRTALVGVVATVAVVTGTIAGISRLADEGSDGRPAAPGAVHSEYVVASGEMAGTPWTLVAVQKQDEWCLQFRVPGSLSVTCEGTSGWEERWAIATGYVGDPIKSGFVLYGAVPSTVHSMYYEFDEGGRTEIAVGAAAEIPHAGFNPFHAELPPRAGTIEAYPEAGQVPVFREHFAPVPPPGPPPMTGLTGVADHFGNAWGEVRSEDLFAPPPPPGTPGPSVAWVPPGLEAGVEEIRGTARIPLALVWTEVGDWWAHRPEPAAPPEEFRGWWDSYPVDANLGLALGKTSYLEDASGHVWAGMSEEDAIALRHATPGEGGRTADYLRIVATTQVPYIAPEAWGWWASRPPTDAPEAAFLGWWEAYPSA